MARKPSVILSVEERKAAQNGLKSEIAAAKDALKALKIQQKALAREATDTEKLLTGLNIRHDALKPIKKTATV